MEIPRYWAEHREQRVLAGRRHVTLRRFGWSADNQEAAREVVSRRLPPSRFVLPAACTGPNIAGHDLARP